MHVIQTLLDLIDGAPTPDGVNTGSITKMGFTTHHRVLPDEVDNGIFVHQVTGQPSNPKWLVDYPSVSVMIRSTEEKYQAALVVANMINDLMLGNTGIDLLADSGRITSITQQGSLNDLGRDPADPKSRHILTLNYKLIVEPNKSALSRRESLQKEKL